jgi:2-amino-4-hydroxy-6-hydroxymethyldihydropteridine diphosphokinase
VIEVSLSLGSNIDRFRHINHALNALERLFGDCQCSPVYESDAVGFDGSPFLNLIVIVRTNKSLSEVNESLKAIEDEHGRDRSGPKFGSRTLDIDVVTYGDFSGVLEGIELPRRELFKNAFVLLPMCDLWPTRQIPGTEMTYVECWAQGDAQTQKLTAVTFERHREAS